MATIRDTLQLDIDAALSSIQEIENALNRAIGIVEVDVDTASAQASIDALDAETVSVTLDADTAAAQNEIDSLSGTVPTVVDLDSVAASQEIGALGNELDTATQATVQVDTGDAQAEIGALGEALDDAASATANVSGGIEDIGTAAGSAAGPAGLFTGALGTSIDNVKTLAGFSVAGFGLTRGIGALKDAATAASDLGESVNAVEVVFGDAADAVLTFTGDTHDAVFAAQADLNQLATVLGSLLQGTGIAAGDAATATQTLIERAADLSSVYNDDVSVAVEKISALLRGETEPIRSYGVVISQADVAARALADGLVEAGEPLDAQAKLLATINLLLDQTADAQGDAANTAGSYAGRQRALNEQFAELQVQLGEAVLPLFESFQDVAINLVPVISDLIDAFGPLFDLVAGVAGAIGTLTDAVDKIPQPVKDAAGAANDFLNPLTGWLSPIGLANRGIGALIDTLSDGSDTIDDAADSLGNIDQATADAARSVPFAQARFEAFGDTLGRTADEIRDEMLQATRDLNDELRDQINPVGDAINSVEDLRRTYQDAAADGRITADEMFNIADAAGDAQLALSLLAAGDVTGGLEELSRLTGLSVDDIQQLLADLGILDGTSVNVDIQDFIDDLDAAAESSTEAKDAYQEFQDTVRASVDPIFAAVRASSNLQDTLTRINEDGQRTTDELFDLAAATADYREAVIRLGQGDVNEGIRQIADLLGITVDEARDLFEAGVLLSDTPIEIRMQLLGAEDVNATIEDYEAYALAGIDIPVNLIPEGVGVVGGSGGATEPVGGSGGGGGVGPGAPLGGNVALQVNINNPSTANIEAAANQAANVISNVVTNTRALLK